MDYWITVAVSIGIQTILAYSFYASFRSGLFAFSQATFMGLGAYAGALVSIRLHLPFPVALLSGILIGGIAGFVLGIVLCGRIKGFFLAVATMAVGQAIVSLYMEWDFVGGVLGLRGIPLSTTIYWSLGACALAFYLFYQIDRSVLGRILWACTDDPLAAETSTISVRWTQVASLVLSGALGGLAGVLYAHQLGNLVPHDFGLMVNMNALLAVLLGGVYSIFGPVLGSIVVVVLPELLRLLGINRYLVFGALLIIVMVFRTEGILGTGRGGRAKSIKRLLRRLRRVGSAAPDIGHDPQLVRYDNG